MAVESGRWSVASASVVTLPAKSAKNSSAEAIDTTIAWRCEISATAWVDGSPRVHQYVEYRRLGARSRAARRA